MTRNTQHQCGMQQQQLEQGYLVRKFHIHIPYLGPEDSLSAEHGTLLSTSGVSEAPAHAPMLAQAAAHGSNLPFAHWRSCMHEPEGTHLLY
jgi:hypothetical protein